MNKKHALLTLVFALLPLTAWAKPSPPANPVLPTGEVIELESQLDFHNETMAKKRLFVFNGQMAVLLAMKAQQVMPEHSTQEPAFLEVLSGEILLITGPKEQRIRAGEAILLPPHHPHKVVATQNAKMLLIRAIPTTP